MAMIISDGCISCDACMAECPKSAISEGKDIYVIDPQKCTECLGIADSPQCVDVCPAGCIYPDQMDSKAADILVEHSKKVHINW